LHIAVADTGIGIARAQQRGIFGPFTQADGSTTRKYGGTGLGLAICGQLVELMGGRIWVESEPNAGATFHFTVRCAAEATTDRATTPVPVDGLGEVRVLVVDDNATNRQILVKTLRNWKARARAVDSGPAALAAVREARSDGVPFALVILDAHMPGMDGVAVAERLMTESDVGRPAIVMLTSAGQGIEAATARRLGIARSLTKPVGGAALLQALAETLGLAEVEAPATRTASPRSRRAMLPLHILLAEDNRVNRMVATRLLQREGHTVVAVEDGAEALRALAREPFDVVLMDVQMPNADGIETTAAIRAQERATGSHVPIVALTAHALKGDQERFLAAGMDAYVAKPLKPAELFAIIDRLVEGPHPTGSGVAALAGTHESAAMQMAPDPGCATTERAGRD
jgi:CheY-like chemotaxis protein